MKRFLKENLFWLILIIITIAITIITILSPKTRDILLIPFYIIGAITILRGIGGIINDLENHIKHTWQIAFVFFVLVLSIIALTNIF